MNLVLTGKQIALFYEKVKITSDCHWWTGNTKSGYGRVRINKKQYYSHRIAWYIHYEEWPLNALHHCDNKLCVKVSHLFDGTQADNVADMISKDRHGHLLSARDYEEIKFLLEFGVGVNTVARHIGVSHTRISQIKKSLDL